MPNRGGFINRSLFMGVLFLTEDKIIIADICPISGDRTDRRSSGAGDARGSTISDRGNDTPNFLFWRKPTRRLSNNPLNVGDMTAASVQDSNSIAGRIGGETGFDRILFA
jgi:hypothetical protein